MKGTIVTKMQKFKKWATDNQENILVGSVMTAVVGAYAAVIVIAIKEQQKLDQEWADAVTADAEHREAVMNWIIDEKNSGNNVYALDDNTYVVIPQDAPQQFVLK
jgi:hypothetical protein